MIDLTIHSEQLEHNLEAAKRENIILPTFAQMKEPDSVPQEIKNRLRTTAMDDLDPVNLFRITWKNMPVEKGGVYGKPNYIELPSSLTGVKARIICLVGKFFPTGCHKVGASYGCLVPRLVTGQFDVTKNKAVWPSTGNYCRGGAFNSALLKCRSVAVMPENMSRERFEWLEKLGAEVLKTPAGGVSELLKAVSSLRNSGEDIMVFDQFEEMGNHLWHYAVTGDAMAEVFKSLGPGYRLAGAVFSSGSAGTTAAGDKLRELYPSVKVAVGEAAQCPTLLNNGFGDHHIEGIGDSSVPWIHDCRQTDMLIGVDDMACRKLLRLFNESAGQEYLVSEAGITDALAEKLPWLGISGIANILAAVKLAKYYELTAGDVVETVLTDSAVLYGSRIDEMAEEDGRYTTSTAVVDFARYLLAADTSYMEELTYYGRKRIHNLKYFTWCEQQGRSKAELDALWYDWEHTFGAVHKQEAEIDALINDFNAKVGLLGSGQ